MKLFCGAACGIVVHDLTPAQNRIIGRRHVRNGLKGERIDLEDYSC